MIVLLLTFISPNLFAKTTPEVEGKLYNHSHFDLSKLKIEVSISCEYEKFLVIGPGGRYESCGHDEKFADIQVDKGSFYLPSVNVWSWRPSADYKVAVKVILSENPQLDPARMTSYFSYGTYEDDRSIHHLKKDLESLSFFSLSKRKLRFKLASGKNFQQWLNDIEINLQYQLKIKMDDGLTKKRAFGWQRSDVKHVIDEQLFVFPKKLKKFPSVKAQAKITPYFQEKVVLAKTKYHGSWRSPLPDRFYSLTLDDSKVKAPNRDLTGKWKGKLLFNIDEESFRFKKVIPIKADVTCEKGSLKGVIHLRNSNEILKVQGTCGKNQALMRVQYPFPVGGTVPLRLNADHINSHSSSFDMQFKYREKWSDAGYSKLKRTK